MLEQTSNPILHRLQQTLETHAPREEVAEALAAAEELGDALPPLLAFRARERIEADRFLDRRRICFGIACSLMVFVSAFSAVGLTTLDRLIETYPLSDFYDEAQFRRGEILFVNKRYAEAESAYGAIINHGPRSAYYEQALYKHGWVLFKRGLHDDSLASFRAKALMYPRARES